MMSSIFNPQNFYWNVYAMPHFTVGVLVMLEGVFVFFQSKKAIMHVAYLFFAVTAGVWLTGVGVSASISNEAVSLAVYRYYCWFGIIFVTPAVYFFSATWRPGLLRKKRKWIIFHCLSGAAFYLICVATPWIVLGLYPYKTGFFPRAGFLEAPFIVWFYAVMSLSFINFIQVYRHETVLLKKKNTKLVFLAFAIGFFGSLEYFPNYGIPVFPVAFFPMFIFATIMGFCVIHYRLMDIQTVIHKTIMWILASSVMGVPVVAFCFFCRNWLQSLPAGWFIGFIALLFLIIVFYTRYIQPRIDHFFQRRQWDLNRALEKFTDELVYLRDIDEVVGHILNTTEKIFYVSDVSLLLRTSNAENFRLIRKGQSQAAGISYCMPEDLLKGLEDNDTVVLGEYVGIDPRFEAFSATARNYFKAMGAQIGVPMIIHQKLIAVLNIGRKENLQPFRPSEIAFLADLRRSAAIALSNSLRLIEMQESLRRWNEGLEEKVKQRTRDLEQAQSQLIQAEKLATIGTLAGGVAHEINNPLTAILTNAQLLKMSISGGEDGESVKLIEEGAKRCQGIVQKLMKYARKPMEAGLDQEVDLNRVIENVIAFLGYQLEQENVRVVSFLKPVARVRGVANELEQVFTNLLLNSKDAIKQKKSEGTVEISTYESESDVCARVRDNGAGIREENLSKIFDPFFTTKDVGSGTGLGLSITYGIVEKHGGKIRVSSKENAGATFVVSFPKAQGA